MKVYVVYIVDSRAYKTNSDGRWIWKHKVLNRGYFTSIKDSKAWARKQKITGLVSAGVYIYLEGENRLYDNYRLMPNHTLKSDVLPHGDFKNHRPQ